ncbi:MAG: hypothetical protein ACFE91_10135 [Promethearchaeota archaeon]
MTYFEIDYYYSIISISLLILIQYSFTYSKRKGKGREICAEILKSGRELNSTSLIEGEFWQSPESGRSIQCYAQIIYQISLLESSRFIFPFKPSYYNLYMFQYRQQVLLI